MVEGHLAFFQFAQIILTTLDVVGVEFEAIHEVAVLHLTGILSLLLLGSLGLLGDFLVAAVAAHDSADGLVGNFASGAEGHALGHGSHHGSEESGSLLSLSRSLGRGLSRGSG